MVETRAQRNAVRKRPPHDNGDYAVVPSGQSPYRVFLPRTFVAFVVVGSAVAAFSFGRYGGAQLLRQRGGFSPTENAASSPVSHYAFFPFDTSQVIRSTFVPLTTEESEKEEGQEEENLLCRKLFMDLNKVNASFLGSRECLARAVQEFSKRSVLPLVYLHSHEHSAGWSLVAALENSSRLTVVTWPDSGMMAIDVVACATDLQQHTLLPLIPLFQETFGVPRDPSEPVSVRWGQIQRGLKEDESNPESTEIDRTLNQVDIDKTFVASVQTKFQRIDVYDLIEPKFRRTVENHRRSLSGDGSYESQHPEFFRKDRVIYLDHVMQSRTFGEAAYHEPLVHPALFAHDNPKRVAIVGGGEGATLREVLKHSTVEKCVMIEIDEAMVNVSRQYIPDWSDCSDLQGSTDSCFDDPRAEVYYEDAIAWFINRFLREEDFTGEDRFDVIIMDALDPNSVVEFSDILYGNEDLMKAFSNALGDNGIMVVQIGEADLVKDPPSVYFGGSLLLRFREGLEKVGFQNIFEYEEMHGRFADPWSYQIAMKSNSNRVNWLANDAQIDLKIQKRAIRTKDGHLPFRYFDGATMMAYQDPPRAVEVIWCREGQSVCDRGNGFDPEIPNTPAFSFEVKAGTKRVHSKVSIPRGSYMALEESVHGMFLPPSTFDMVSRYSFVPRLAKYVGAVGWVHDYFGGLAAGADPGIMAFVTHGTDETFNAGTFFPDDGPQPNSRFPKTTAVFDPYTARHCGHFLSWFDALIDITAGEAILDSYLLTEASYFLEDLEAETENLKQEETGYEQKTEL